MNPIDFVLSRLEGVHKNGNGWTAHCPAHEDHQNSLSLHQGNDGRALLHCFAGCTCEEILAVWGLEMRDLFPEDGRRPRGNGKPTGRSRLTVADLARDKNLPEAFLRKLGVVEENGVLRIAYLLADGSPAPRQRLRSALRAKEGSYWSKGKGEPVPYGLWRLEEAHKQGYLVLVEGESDCWTLWHHGIPALGIPGADMTSKLRAEYLAGISRLLAVHELDHGGEIFVAGAARQLKELGWAGTALMLRLPNAKDPNDLHKKLHGDKEKFAEVWKSVLEEALPLPVTRGEKEAGRPWLTPEQIAEKRQELEKLQAEEAEEKGRPAMTRKAIEEVLQEALKASDPIKALEEKMVPALAQLDPISLDDSLSRVIRAYRGGGHGATTSTIKKAVEKTRQKAKEGHSLRQARIENLQEDIIISERLLANPEAEEEGEAALIEGLDDEGEEGGNKKPRGMADRLIDYALSDPKQTLLFCDQHGQPHALVSGQPVPLTPRCYKWLRRLIWEHEEKSATGEALAQATGLLAAKAEATGEMRELYVRSAWHNGSLFIELVAGQVLRIDADGWQLDDSQIVLFRRFVNSKSLPMPQRGGRLNTLLDLLPLSSERDKRMLIAYLTCGLLPHIPRPILLATGAMGSGKTTLHRIIKRLLDPTTPETMRLDPRDALQKASHCAVVLCDNLSHLADWQIDMLCRWVTGEGDSKRVLYSDDDDFIVEIKRLVLLNGINPPADRADFQDRSVPIELERIAEDKRKTEEEIWAVFYREHAGWLGCLFDLLSAAMKLKDSLRLPSLPRLADWGKWAAAVYEVAEWEESNEKGAALFQADWGEIVERQQAAVLDGSTLAQVVLAFMEGRDEWTGTPSDLLAGLQEAAATLKVDPKRDRSFPASAKWLWRRMREILSLLVARGVEVSRSARGKGRDITIRKSCKNVDGVDGVDDDQENQASQVVNIVVNKSDNKNVDDDVDDGKPAPAERFDINVNTVNILSKISGSDWEEIS